MVRSAKSLLDTMMDRRYVRNQEKCLTSRLYIGFGFLNKVAENLVKSFTNHTRVYIISDVNVARIYSEILKNSFQSLQIQCTVLLPEQPYTPNCIQEQIEEVAGEKFILSVGGSSICKLSNTLADSFRNCIGYAFIPTTLRGCVSVNIEDFFRLVEAKQCQPKKVYIDLSTLRSLPRRHFMNGMSEIIKVAVISSSGWRKWTMNVADEFKEIISPNQNELLELIEINANQLICVKEDLIVDVVTRTLQIKSDIINLALKYNKPHILDVLRLGNIIGEAIKAVTSEMSKGECTAIGLVKEAELYGEKTCSFSTVGRLVRCLKRFELPTRISQHINIDEMLAKISTFPKSSTINSLKFVLEREISIVPGQKVSGTLRVPGSKSISNRVLLMAAMGSGVCHITGILHSDDTQVMIIALERVGATFKWIDNDEVLVVNGTGGNFRIADAEREIFINHSGTSARFLTTFLTLVKREMENPIVLTGSSRMKERPIGPLVDSLRTKECKIEYLESNGCLPLAIDYTGLRGGLLRMSAKLSSTFVTSVLLGAPYASAPITIELEEDMPTSLPYILMTIQLMAKFNIYVERQGLNRFVVPCGGYENPSHLEVEIDASSATYPLAMAAVTGGTVSIHGLGKQSLQGDAKFYTLLQKMGCTAVQCDSSTTVTGPSNGVLQSVNINMETMTDAFMTTAVVGAVASGITQITGISNQRVKESNRIEVMVTELQKIGIPSGELDDGMWVEGIGNWSFEEKKQRLKKAYISCHNDHRIAMSFAVLGCVLDQIIITDKECTDKTYPSFWHDCRNKLGLIFQPNYVDHNVEVHKSIVDRKQPPCIFIIGMRGCGKSILGLKASKTLKLNFIDMDILFEEQFQETLSNFVSKYGWEQFRNEESQLLEKLITTRNDGTIISCGGGIVESEMARMLLKNYSYVIYIERDLDSIFSNLNQECSRHRAQLNEPVESTYRRRIPWYEECSKFKFVNNLNGGNIDIVHDNFAKFLSDMIPNMS